MCINTNISPLKFENCSSLKGAPPPPLNKSKVTVMVEQCFKKMKYLKKFYLFQKVKLTYEQTHWNINIYTTNDI